MKQKTTNISLWIKPDVLEKLDKFSKRFIISRSQVIINFIDIGLDEIRYQDNLGIVKLMLALNEYTSKISKLLKGAEQEIILDIEDQRGINVSVRINSDLVAKIDKFSKEIKMSRSTFIEYLLYNSIENMSMLTFVGFTDTVIFVEKLRAETRILWKKLIKNSEKILKNGKVITHKDGDQDDSIKK